VRRQHFPVSNPARICRSCSRRILQDSIATISPFRSIVLILGRSARLLESASLEM